MTEKTIIYDRTSRDFLAYLDDEFIGAFGSYHDAEVELDWLAFNMMTHGATPAGRPNERSE